MSDQIEPPSERPGPDQLAGVYVLIEGEELSFGVPASDRPAPALGEVPATVEELAGVNLRFEGNEKDLFPPPSAPSETLP
jgi:hypothetical protein